MRRGEKKSLEVYSNGMWHDFKCDPTRYDPKPY